MTNKKQKQNEGRTGSSSIAGTGFSSKIKDLTKIVSSEDAKVEALRQSVYDVLTDKDLKGIFRKCKVTQYQPQDLFLIYHNVGRGKDYDQILSVYLQFDEHNDDIDERDDDINFWLEHLEPSYSTIRVPYKGSNHLLTDGSVFNGYSHKTYDLLRDETLINKNKEKYAKSLSTLRKLALGNFDGSYKHDDRFNLALVPYHEVESTLKHSHTLKGEHKPTEKYKALTPELFEQSVLSMIQRVMKGGKK